MASLRVGKCGVHRLLEAWCLRTFRQPARNQSSGQLPLQSTVPTTNLAMLYAVLADDTAEAKLT